MVKRLVSAGNLCYAHTVSSRAMCGGKSARRRSHRAVDRQVDKVKGKKFVSAIFDPEPTQWGLRGDPFLWQYLRDCCAQVRLPYSPEKFQEDVLRIFMELTGKIPEPGGQYFAEKFAKVHVGMSTGCLSGDFWLEQGIPMLLRRLKEQNAALR